MHMNLFHIKCAEAHAKNWQFFCGQSKPLDGENDGCFHDGLVTHQRNTRWKQPSLTNLMQ